MAGYFCGAQPSVALTELRHSEGVLTTPARTIWVPFKGTVFLGSGELLKRYLGEHEDERFRKYFHPSGPTLDDGLAHAKGYIEACCDPLASEIDSLCKGMGGHIHAAAVTPSGFKWLIEPK